MPKKLTEGEALRRLALCCPDFLPTSPYPGIAKPWTGTHTKCGREVKPYMSNLQNGIGCCAYCAGLAKMSHQEAITRVTEACPDFIPTTEYPGAKLPWTGIHRPCGSVFNVRLYELLKNGLQSCRKCNPPELNVKGERQCSSYGSGNHADGCGGWVSGPAGNPGMSAECRSAYARERSNQAKKLLGGKCSCCPIQDLDLLQFDHIEAIRKTMAQRSSVGESNSALISKILSGKPTPHVQLMCRGCNAAKGVGDECQCAFALGLVVLPT